ncbi:transcriptional repressor [Ruficoccus sp. ZRK36]|uniref:Fur family transcriptional regulator n=1 Tax=Ruficoccus sp. ZRK36 TaxID=2866311 RepID=UPI001C72F887|nr:transcriptional repressor [Ruficoccus sp. ZRK36]QYY36197.1 transcriptional repressor [Ruficoccus sp. ZRK36]
MPSPVRETRQRTAIRNALETQRRPLKPKEILEYAQLECKGLGIATVYRNLHTMVDEGTLEVIDIPGLTTCYCIPRKTKQPILVCRQTGEMHWLDSKPVNVELDHLPPQFEYAGHEIIVYGHFRSE